MHLCCEHTHVKQGIKIISDLIQLLPQLNIKQAVLAERQNKDSM